MKLPSANYSHNVLFVLISRQFKYEVIGYFDIYFISNVLQSFRHLNCGHIADNVTLRLTPDIFLPWLTPDITHIFTVLRGIQFIYNAAVHGIDSHIDMMAPIMDDSSNTFIYGPIYSSEIVMSPFVVYMINLRSRAECAISRSLPTHVSA